MEDGSVIFEASIDDKKLNRDLEKIRSKIDKLQKAFDEKNSRKGFLESRSKSLAAELDRKKAILNEMRTAPKGTYEKIDLSEQSERVRGIQAEFNKVNNELDRINEKLPKMEEELGSAKTEAANLTKTIEGRRKGAGIRNAIEGASDSAERFNRRLKLLAKNALLFSVMSKALSAFRNWAKDVILVNADARESFAQLKAALLTLAQPLVSVIVPAFTMLVRVITAVITQVSRLVALITGKSVKSSADAAKALNKQTKALNETGSAAEEAAGSLASFDEINQLSSDTGSSSGSGAVTDFSDIEPDFSYLDEMSERLQKIAKYILLIAAGLALWKIASNLPGILGEILTKIAGIAIAIGGLILLWDGLADAWENGLDWGNFLEILAGAVALVGGLTLAFGKTGAEIGLAVVAASLMISAFKDMCENGLTLENVLVMLAGVIAGGLGISLLTGSWIPTLIAGFAAALLCITAFFGDGEAMIEALEEIIQGFKDFFSAVFVGDMEAAGEALSKVWDGIKKAAAIMWEALKKAVKAFLNWCWDWICDAFDNLIAKTAEFGENMRAKLSEILENIKTKFKTWGSDIKEWFSALVKGIVNAGLAKVESFINHIISGLNWLISKINSISFTVPDWVPNVGGKSVGFNLKPVSTITLPRLASGAVIPPNREFLAVLGDQKSGTNIETPLSTMIDAFKRAMAETGSNGTTTVVVTLDGREVARNTVKHVNDMTRQAGKPILLY